MDKLKDRIDILNNVMKIFEESKYLDIKNTMKLWESMKLLNPWYVINEKNNIIKLSWCDKSPIINNCIAVTWDKNYTNCKLLIYGKIQLIEEDKINEISINKGDVLELEKYIEKYDFLHYSIKKEDKILSVCDGSRENNDLEIEVKINNLYNEVSSCAEKMSVSYNFSDLIFKLYEENINKAKSTII